MKLKSVKTNFITGFAILFCFFVFVSESDAQNSKRKQKRTLTPIVLPTPIPQQSVPVIVSRAEDYQNDNRIVIPDNQQTQTNSGNAPERTEDVGSRITELNTRIKSLESTQKNEYDEKQKRLLLNLDILSRSEQRAEALRKQLFELVEKESAVRTRIDQINFDARPEMVDRSAAFSGSLRPEEIREQRKKSLDAEKRNAETLLSQIQSSRTKLEETVQRADTLVEKVRYKLEKEIEDALLDDKNQ